MSDVKTMPDIEVGDFLLSRDDKQQGIVSLSLIHISIC